MEVRKNDSRSESSNEGETLSDLVTKQVAVLKWRPAESAGARPKAWMSPVPVPTEEPWPHLSAATEAQPPRCPRHQTGRTRRAAAPTSAYRQLLPAAFGQRLRYAGSPGLRASSTFHPAGNVLRPPCVLPAFWFRAADWLKCARRVGDELGGSSFPTAAPCSAFSFALRCPLGSAAIRKSLRSGLRSWLHKGQDTVLCLELASYGDLLEGLDCHYVPTEF